MGIATSGTPMTPRESLEPNWVFPKTRAGLALLLLRRAMFLTGMFWIVRGLVGSSLIPSPYWMVAARIAFYLCVAGALTVFGAWYAFLLFWIVPYCTWHIVIQYARIICEHSAVESDDEEYGITRTTIPTLIESIFILPCNVGYHIEHHWYPSVPFYRLPDLHKELMAREGFRRHAVVRRSILASLGECVARTANTAAAVQHRIADVPRTPIPGSEIEPAIAKNFLNDLLIQPIKAGDLH